MIKVEIDQVKYRDAQKALRSLRKSLPRDAVSAMSKTVTSIVRILTDATADVLNLTKGRIKDDITVEIKGAEIDSDNVLSKFLGAVRSTGQPLGLVQFATNANTWQQGRSVNVKIFKGRETIRFTHAFIAKGSGASLSQKTGDIKKHMWEREGKRSGAYNPRRKYAQLPYSYRFPIKRLTTVRIQDIQAQPDLIGQVLKDIGEDALKGLRDQMDITIKAG
jgi:hypothetical protein